MGTGYTRNDTINNIADGNIINAADFDGEYDAIEAAFNSSTGHSHDGTSGEGGPVTVLGPAQDFVASTTDIKPKTNNTLDIGTTSLKFKDMYLAGTANLADVTTTGDVTLTGAAYNIVFDASDNALEFADNAKAAFGDATTPDLQIYHDGTDNYIESNAGELYIQGDGITLRSDTDTETYITMDKDGAVALYYDNSKKFETTDTGIAVTGSIALDGIHLDDNEKATFGDSTTPDLEIYHNGTNSIIENNTGELFIQGNNITLRSDTDTETFIAMDKDGAVELYHDNVKKFDTDADGVNVTGQIDVSTNVNLTSDSGAINLGADGEVTLTHVADTGVTLNVENSTTNGVTDVLKLQAQSSGTPAVGIGTGVEFSTETAAGTLETGGVIESVTTSLTPTSEEFDMVFKTMSAGATAAERLKLNGDGATVGNLNLDGNTLSSTDTNGHVVVAPNGIGDVQLDADTVRVGDSNTDVTITTNGTGDLTLNTNAGTNSGVITIADGAGGDISITPNGAGSVDIGKLKIASGATAISSILDEDTLSSDSATALATQQSIKAYVDNTFTGGSFGSGISVDGANIDIADDFGIDFEGASFTTTLGKAAPTAARTITLPDADGTVITTGNTEALAINGLTALTDPIADADEMIVYDASGAVNVKATFSQIKTYLTSAGFSTDDPTALAIALG
jgi:hypothetical protein